MKAILWKNSLDLYFVLGALLVVLFGIYGGIHNRQVEVTLHMSIFCLLAAIEWFLLTRSWMVLLHLSESEKSQRWRLGLGFLFVILSFITVILSFISVEVLGNLSSYITKRLLY